MQGRVLGIVCAPFVPGGRAAGYGLGYALPVDTVRGLVDQIVVAGRATRPALGITLAPPQVRAWIDLLIDGVPLRLSCCADSAQRVWLKTLGHTCKLFSPAESPIISAVGVLGYTDPDSTILDHGGALAVRVMCPMLEVYCILPLLSSLALLFCPAGTRCLPCRGCAGA
jgi:hypothetical protein